MSIDIKIIKQMDASECYNYRLHEGILQLVIVFLKENPDKAFTPHEITEGLNQRNYKNVYSKSIKKNTLVQVLYKYKKRKGKVNIKCKGIYYWYEKDK